MDLKKLQDKLLETARRQGVSDHVPFAFEQRIMARLGRPAFDLATAWVRPLWRAAAVCLALSVMLSLWSVISAHTNEPVTLETTVLSMAEQLSDNW